MNVFLKTAMIEFAFFFTKDLRVKGEFTIDDHSKVFSSPAVSSCLS